MSAVGRMMRDPGREVRRIWRNHAQRMHGPCGCMTCDAYVDRTQTRATEKRHWSREIGGDQP